MQHILYLNYNFFPPRNTGKKGEGDTNWVQERKKKKGCNKKRYFPPHPFSHSLSTPPVWDLGLARTPKLHLYWKESVNGPQNHHPFTPKPAPGSSSPPHDATQSHSQSSQFLARTRICSPGRREEGLPPPGPPGPGAVFWGRNPQFEGNRPTLGKLD